MRQEAMAMVWVKHGWILDLKVKSTGFVNSIREYERQNSVQAWTNGNLESNST
jgi:hypothetical protein